MKYLNIIIKIGVVVLIINGLLVVYQQGRRESQKSASADYLRDVLSEHRETLAANRQKMADIKRQLREAGVDPDADNDEFYNIEQERELADWEIEREEELALAQVYIDQIHQAMEQDPPDLEAVKIVFDKVLQDEFNKTKWDVLWPLNDYNLPESVYQAYLLEEDQSLRRVAYHRWGWAAVDSGEPEKVLTLARRVLDRPGDPDIFQLRESLQSAMELKRIHAREFYDQIHRSAQGTDVHPVLFTEE